MRVSLGSDTRQQDVLEIYLLDLRPEAAGHSSSACAARVLEDNVTVLPCCSDHTFGTAP